MPDPNPTPAGPVPDLPSEYLPPLRANQKLTGFNIALYEWSRSATVLSFLCFAVMVVCFALGWMWQKRDAQPDALKQLQSETVQESEEELDKALAKGTSGYDRLFPLLAQEGLDLGREGAQGMVEKIQIAALTPVQKQVASEFWLSLVSRAREPNAMLSILAYQPNPAAKANEAVGDLYLLGGRRDLARFYFERELRFHPTEDLRQKIIDLAFADTDSKWLRELAANPDFQGTMTPAQHLEVSILAKDWPGITSGLLQMQLRSLHGRSLILAVIAGLVWITVLLQAIQPPTFFSFRTFIIFPAVLAGALSTFPTMLVGIWHEDALGLTAHGDFVQHLRFYLLGVGPREELIKLIFFLPFVPFLLVRKNRLEMLIVASAVGLGFAIEENLTYIEMGGGIVALPRLLTANFLHLSLTGLFGLSLCEGLLDLKRSWVFLLTGLSVILTHGTYDIFASIPLAKVDFIYLTIFLISSMFYFRRLRSVREDITDQISMAATVLIGISVVAGSGFVVAAEQVGFVPAVLVLGAMMLMYVMTGYLFYWQLGMGMSHAYAAEMKKWKERSPH